MHTAISIPGKMRFAMWLATPVITGAVIMSLELVAFRLYAPYFGYSIYVWGSMISVVMAALAAGYVIGGRLADRCRGDLPLYCTILASALFQLGIIRVVHSLLPWLAQLGDVAGATLATLIIFAPSMLALAVVAPFVIRLLAQAGRIGTLSGTANALSTVGGIGGILATSFLLVPEFGTQATMMIACVLSALIGVVGITANKRIGLLAILPFAALPAAPGPPRSANTIWESESTYNLVRVERENSRLLLVLNDEISVHSIRNGTTAWTGRYYDDFALGPLLVSARHALVLGMGAGASIAATRAVAPNLDVDAVEIDPRVIEAGVRFFGVPANATWLHTHLADARQWLTRSEDKYDLVQVDLYQGGPYVPFYLATIEFFSLTRAHLVDDGLLMMNVFDPGRDHLLVYSVLRTLKHVFPSVLVLDTGSGNHVVFAFQQSRSITLIRSQLNQPSVNSAVEQIAHDAARWIVDLTPPKESPIFTDDLSQIEQITRSALDN